jgi:hypothetical protein
VFITKPNICFIQKVKADDQNFPKHIHTHTHAVTDLSRRTNGSIPAAQSAFAGPSMMATSTHPTQPSSIATAPAYPCSVSASDPSRPAHESRLKMIMMMMMMMMMMMIQTRPHVEM